MHSYVSPIYSNYGVFIMAKLLVSAYDEMITDTCLFLATRVIYHITVSTGDRKGANTDAKVGTFYFLLRVILY